MATHVHHCAFAQTSKHFANHVCKESYSLLVFHARDRGKITLLEFVPRGLAIDQVVTRFFGDAFVCTRT